MQVEGGGGGLVCLIQNVRIVPPTKLAGLVSLLTTAPWISCPRWQFVSKYPVKKQGGALNSTVLSQDKGQTDFSPRLTVKWRPIICSANGELPSELEQFKAVLRIHDILGWIRIRGSMPLTNGSGSCYFRHWPSRCQHKTNFLTQFFSA